MSSATAVSTGSPRSRMRSRRPRTRSASGTPGSPSRSLIECISWESVAGRPEEKPNAGRVTFEPLGTSACRVTFGIDWEPEAGLEANEAYVLDAVNQMLAADLARFKDLIEARAARHDARTASSPRRRRPDVSGDRFRLSDLCDRRRPVGPGAFEHALQEALGLLRGEAARVHELAGEDALGPREQLLLAGGQRPCLPAARPGCGRPGRPRGCPPCRASPGCVWSERATSRASPWERRAAPGAPRRRRRPRRPCADPHAPRSPRGSARSCGCAATRW